MPSQHPDVPTVKLSDLLEAFAFASASELDENQAYICRRSGRIICVSDGLDLEEETEFAEDPDATAYQPVPHKHDLDLGKRVALAFVRETLPDAFDQASDMFSRKGAYRRFRQFLLDTGTLETWYAFEERATKAALIAWCDEVGIGVIDDEHRSAG